MSIDINLYVLRRIRRCKGSGRSTPTAARTAEPKAKPERVTTSTVADPVKFVWVWPRR
jgi:hypothetical protein